MKKTQDFWGNEMLSYSVGGWPDLLDVFSHWMHWLNE